MQRFVVTLLLVVAAVCGAGIAARAQAVSLRSHFDRRIDALPARRLLHDPPQALVDPSRQRGARNVADVQHGIFVAWAAAQIWAFGWLWRSGNAARLRDVLRRRLRARVATRAAFGAALGIIAPLAGFPPAFISYRVGFNVGLTEEHIGGWILHYGAGMLVDAAATALAVTVVLELVDRTRFWYLAFIAFLFALGVTVATLDPPWRGAAMLPPPAVHAAAPVVVIRASERTRKLVARTAGIGAASRIILGDTTVAAVTAPELAFVVAREDAHVRHHDVLKLALIATTLVVVATALAVLISDRFGFRRDDDPLSRLALVVSFLGVVGLVMYPLYTAYVRGIEFRADQDARTNIGAAVPAVRYFVRVADDDMVELCRRRSSSWYFADRPAIGSRIAAMRGSADPCAPSPLAP